MNNSENYKNSYYMPPEVTYDWVQRESITKAPIWASIDLGRTIDAEKEPIGIQERVDLFKLLVEVGFQEIELGAPGAEEETYQFIRILVERRLIPQDVTIQVVTYPDEQVIRKTFAAISGIPKVIIHLQRRGTEEHHFVQKCVRFLKILSTKVKNDIRLEYSIQSFQGNEIQTALEECNEVIQTWNPTEDSKMIVNIPSAMGVVMPHVYACQIEYLHKHIWNRECVMLSIRPQNNRKTVISDAELGILAGADRVEGILFSNEIVNGNVELADLAVNMMGQGVYHGLRFSDMEAIRYRYEEVCGVRQHERMPYHTGNSGIAHILKRDYGIILPTAMKEEVTNLVKELGGKKHEELSSPEIYQIFKETYVNHTPIFDVLDLNFNPNVGALAKVEISHGKEQKIVETMGNGRLDSVINAVKIFFGIQFELVSYEEHAISMGAITKVATTEAATFVCIVSAEKKIFWGVGIDDDIVHSSIKALVSAINKLLEEAHITEGREDRIVDIINYIQKNYQKVTLDILVEEFHLTKPYLSKYIRVKSGMTFQEVVKDIRMRKARMLLKETNDTVEHIAASVGYENVEHFDRLFKKMFHMTPSQYQKNEK